MNLLPSALRHALLRKLYWEDAPNAKQVQPNNLSWDTTYGGWSFTNVSNRDLWIITQFSHNKALGTDVIPHIHWQPTTAVVANVQWQLEYWYLNTAGGPAQGAAGTTVTITVATNGTAYEPQVDSWAAVSPPAGETLSAFFVAKITRLGAADAYNSTVLMKDFDPHYERDSMGSWLEFFKWG